MKKSCQDRHLNRPFPFCFEKEQMWNRVNLQWQSLLCEREPNKRKGVTFHRDVYGPPRHTNKHSTSWRFDLVSPWRLDHSSGVLAGHPRNTLGRYDGRPWVAQPHEHVHATQVTDTSVEHGWRPHKPGSGVEVRGTEALCQSRQRRESAGQATQYAIIWLSGKLCVNMTGLCDTSGLRRDLSWEVEGRRVGL